MGAKIGVVGRVDDSVSGSYSATGGSFSVYSTGGTNYGVYSTAQNGTTNWAGYFVGNVNVNNGELFTSASSSSRAGVNLPHGTAPSTPANGDLWTTTGGLYARINGATGTVWTSSNDGAGSSLDADLLDGQHASAFMGSGVDNWVNVTGDTMTGTLQLNPTTQKGIIGFAALSTTYNVIDIENTGSGIPIVGTTHYVAPFLSSSYGVKGVADGSSALGANRGVYGQASAAFTNMGVQGGAIGNIGTKYALSGYAIGQGTNYGASLSATDTTATENYGIKATASGATIGG